MTQGRNQRRALEVNDFGAAIGASVTVEGTRLGTASDRNDDYVITGVPAGQHRLIFAYAGCKKAMRVVNVAPWKSLTQNVQLERRPPRPGISRPSGVRYPK